MLTLSVPGQVIATGEPRVTDPAVEGYMGAGVAFQMARQRFACFEGFATQAAGVNQDRNLPVLCGYNHP